MKKYNIALVGATGMVGSTFLNVLEKMNFPADNCYFYASAKSAGKSIYFCGKEYKVIELKKENITDKKIDVALFSAGGSVSLEYAPVFASCGCVVIDNSSAWRRDENVPLVVPEVNPYDLKKHNGIIANPNCSTIQAVVALKPLHDAFKIKRIVYSTYQAVSGSGLKGYNDLKNGIEGKPPQNYPYPIFANVLPHIDVFLDNGYTKEEDKMIFETKKILGDQSLLITATTVRVPVYYGHCESVNVEFYNDCDVKGVIEALSNAPGIIVYDDVKNNKYPMPITCEGKDEVFVGRIRKDYSVKSGVNLWVVADNIRKGAATNTVQIANSLIEQNLI